MKFNCLLLLTVLFTVTSSIAQNTIRGSIQDADSKEALFGATVYIPDLKTGAETDSLGHFIINNVPKGNFLAEIRFIGYATKAISLSTSDSKEFPIITLTKTPTEMHAVVVTGVSGSTEKARNPVPTELASREHLLTSASGNLVAGIANLPGMSQVSTGSAISKPVIRGLGYNRVVVLRNGMRQEGQQWGDEHGIEMDEYEVDRVEIIKGPGSIMYGSDAMAGVINFLTPKPVEEGKIKGEVMLNGQSNSNLLGSSFMTAGNLKGISWQGRFSQKKSGNFSTPADGKVFNSGFEEYDGSGYVGLNRKWGFSQLSFSTFNQTIGMPEGERDSLGNFTKVIPSSGYLNTSDTISLTKSDLSGWKNSLEIPRQKINHQRVLLSNSFYFGDSKLKADFGFQQNHRREFGNIFDSEKAGLDFLLNTANANIAYFFPENNGRSISLGIGSQFQNSKNLGTEFLIPAYQLFDLGAYAYFQKQKDKWFVNGGIRIDNRSLNSAALYLDANGNPSDQASAIETKFSAFKRNFTAVSGSTGVTYQFNSKSVARINFSKGFRSPNLAELGANGVHEGTFRYESGNQNLKPENSLQADAGFTFTSDHFTFDASAFYNNIQDFIYLQKLNSVFGGDSIHDPLNQLSVFTFVQGNAALYGGEISFDLHPHPLDWLHFENSFSYVRGTQFNQPDSMSNLPFIPPARLETELHAQISNAKGIFQHSYLSISGNYFFSQNKIYNAFGTENATPAYLILDSGIGSDFLNKKKEVCLRLFISLSNVLDTKYQSHLSRLKYAPVNQATGEEGIFNPGRNISLRMVIPLNFK